MHDFIADLENLSDADLVRFVEDHIGPSGRHTRYHQGFMGSVAKGRLIRLLADRIKRNIPETL